MTRFLDIFIDKDEKNDKKYLEIEFKKKRKIKYNWLRNSTKNEFYDWKNKNSLDDKKYFLRKIDYLPAEFLRWLNEWTNLVNKLENLTKTKKYEHKRRSEIAFILRGFLKQQNFRFIQDFFNSVVDVQEEQGVEDDKKIRESRKYLNEVEENLKSCERKYLSTQSNGVLLCKASLNYYTLNKTQKEYKELKEEKKDILYKSTAQESISSNPLEVKWFYRNKNEEKIELFSIDKDFLERMKVDGEIIDINILDNLYYALKKWKAGQKSKFNEEVAGDKLTIKNFKEKFPLFSTSDNNFEKFYELTKKLDGAEENDAKKIAQKRGEFFNAPKLQTKNYSELCELYKRIARKRGEIISEIKGIENEEVQSQLFTHWAMIMQEGENKYAVMVPRGENGENHKEAHDFIEKDLKIEEDGEITLYHFKSLTLRALEKLCFKKIENTFLPEIKKEIEDGCIPKYKEEWRNDINQCKLIKFYQKVLETNYVKKYLDLMDFGGLEDFLKTPFNDLQRFESALEKVCYVKTPLKISKDEFKNFVKIFDAKVFEMTTRSISKDSKRKENKHAEIWKEFWSDRNKDHSVRLNPEMSIFYRDKVEGKSNDLRENKKLDSEDNRFSSHHYTLATTVTLNATNKKTNLAFKTTNDIKEYIDEFNKQFNKEFDGKWFYGIDRGLKELATLNVVKFSNEKNEFGVYKPKEFAKIPVYNLRDENVDLKDSEGNILQNAKKENRKVIDNISEVLEEEKKPDEDLFDEKIVSSIDLTQAKLIKGHIILNGDKKTCLKLRELSAKRRIFELFSTSKINKNSEVKYLKGGTFRIGENAIYWYTKEQKNSEIEKEKLKSIFIEYLEYISKNLKNEDLEQVAKIEKINNLRDAITANMVGILFYLQTKFKMKGFIGLENLDTIRNQKREDIKDKKMIDEHSDQSNQDISRRLEWALYRKFANLGVVPPQIKESILLRDNFSTYQIGILKFVEVKNTSRKCPKCEEIWNESCNNNCDPKCDKCVENKKYKKNKDKNIFVCKKEGNCTFSSEKPLEKRSLWEQNLYNSDEVAAYNIAKNTFNNIY